MAIINRSQVTFGLTASTAPKVGNYIIYDGSDLRLYTDSTWKKLAANPVYSGTTIGGSSYTDTNTALEALASVVASQVSGVSSVNNKTGAVTLGASDIGIETIEGLSASNIQEALSAINTKASTAYHAKGDATWEQIQALESPAEGDVYNVTTSFTLDGKTYPAGTNVVCTATTPSVVWDVLSGFIDLSGYQPKNVADATATAIGLTTDKSVDAALVALNTNKANLSGATFTGAVTVNSSLTASTITTSTATLGGTSVTGIDDSSDVSNLSSYTALDSNLITAKGTYDLIEAKIGQIDYSDFVSKSASTTQSLSASLNVSGDISAYSVSVSSLSVDSGITLNGGNITGWNTTVNVSSIDTSNLYVESSFSAADALISSISAYHVDVSSYIYFEPNNVTVSSIDTASSINSSYSATDNALLTAGAVKSLIDLEIADIDYSNYLDKSTSAPQSVAGDITFAGSSYTFSNAGITADSLSAISVIATGVDATNVSISSSLTLRGVDISSIANDSAIGGSDFSYDNNTVLTASAVYTLIGQETSSFIPNGGTNEYSVASNFSVGNNLTVANELTALSSKFSIADGSNYALINIGSGFSSGLKVDASLTVSSDITAEGNVSISGSNYLSVGSTTVESSKITTPSIEVSGASISSITTDIAFNGSYITYDGVTLGGIDTSSDINASDYSADDSHLITAKAVMDTLSDGYVNLGSAQTITGKKTFSAEIVASTGINTTTGITNIGGKVERVVPITDSGSITLSTGVTKAHVTWSAASALIEYDVFGSTIYQEIVQATDAYSGGMTSASAGIMSFSGTGTAYVTELA